MSKKKKMMLISPMLHQGGFERVCVTTARLLAPYFDITIVIFDSADIAYDVEGLSIIDIHLGVRKGKIGKLLNIIRRSLKVRKLKKEMKPEIVYSFGATANMVNAFSKTGKEKVWLGLRSYRDVEETVKIQLFVKLADLFVCCSKDIESVLKSKFGAKKTAVLYNSYDVAAIRSQALEGKVHLPFEETDENGKRIRYLITMGRDDDLKGYWHLLKVFYLIHEKFPESRLVLIGDGSFDKYKQLARELNLLDKVYFTGLQKNPYPYLAKGEIYLLTSVNEGFPNALAEGMALSLAPVSVNCKSGPAEILTGKESTDSAASILRQKKENGEKSVIYGEYGILVPAMDGHLNLDAGEISEEERNMADVVMDLMANPLQLQFYQKAAGERAAVFTYENYVKQILHLSED